MTAKVPISMPASSPVLPRSYGPTYLTSRTSLHAQMYAQDPCSCRWCVLCFRRYASLHGPGNVFLEVHEPCDYTFRAEKNYLPDRTFSDYEMNYGLGMDGLMDAFHYETYTEEEILQKCVLEPSTLFETEGARAETIVSYRQAKRFQVEKYTFTSDVTVPAFDGHRIAITVKAPASSPFRLYGRGSPGPGRVPAPWC